MENEYANIPNENDSIPKKYENVASYPTEQVNNPQSSQTMPPPPPPAYSISTNPVQQPGQYTYVTQTTVTPRPSSSIESLRQAIPVLPMGLAITYCIINIFLPGIGTVLAGFSVLCCGNVGQSDSGRFGTFCINFWIGIAQLVLVLFTIGWIWSIFWGVAFIIISAEAKRQKDQPQVVTTTTTTAVPITQLSTNYQNPPQYIPTNDVV